MGRIEFLDFFLDQEGAASCRHGRAVGDKRDLDSEFRLDQLFLLPPPQLAIRQSPYNRPCPPFF
jgi:hypothetical protein